MNCQRMAMDRITTMALGHYRAERGHWAAPTAELPGAVGPRPVSPRQVSNEVVVQRAEAA